MRSTTARISPYRVAIVFPADPERRQKTRLEDSRFILWDPDFLYGEKGADGADTYILCEINVSSVYPFPDDALGPLAAATLAQIERSADPAATGRAAR